MMMSQTKDELNASTDRSSNSNRSSPDEMNVRSQCSSLSDRDLITEENFESFGDNEDVEYDR